MLRFVLIGKPLAVIHLGSNSHSLAKSKCDSPDLAFAKQRVEYERTTVAKLQLSID